MDNKQLAAWINTLGGFCGRRDMQALTRESLREAQGIDQVDVLVLFGGSILNGGDLFAQAMEAGLAKAYLIVGGAGHTTENLRQQVHRELPDFETAGLPEAEVFAGYLQHRYGLRPDLLERESTNCGNNVTYCLKLLREQGIAFDSILLMQDATMQRRMDAGFRKQISDDTRIFNFAAYQAEMEETQGRLRYCKQIHGMWEMEHYLSLLLGEIPRLTDDENGYGPCGKGFIAHVTIPEEVRYAHEQLKLEYGGLVRKANPAFASKSE